MNSYFAVAATDDVGLELCRKLKRHRESMSGSSTLERAKRAYAFYYGRSQDRDSSRVLAGGSEGELQLVNINHFRNVIQHVLVLTTGERPSFQPRALNSDVESIERTLLARGVLEEALYQDRNERKLIQAVEAAILLGEGYAWVDWDFFAGELLGTETLEDDQSAREDAEPKHVPVYSGKVRVTAPLFDDVVRDEQMRGGNDNWVIVTDWANKWDLASVYPEHEDSLLEAKHSEPYSSSLRSLVDQWSGLRDTDSDVIPVYYFYHRQTPAVPDGRQVVFLGDGTVLTDTPLPIDRLPVIRLSPSEQLGTHRGYTPAFDALSIQQLIDALHSIIATNQSATGVPAISFPPGFDWRGIINGLSCYEVPEGSSGPQPIQLTSTPAEVFSYLSMLPGQMEVIMGLNSVVRGQPGEQFKSGSSLAMMQSLAVKFNSALQASYRDMLEDVGYAMLWFSRHYVDVDRVSLIAGESGKHRARSWTGSEIGDIRRVTVDLGNPLMRTAAGRKEIADDLAQKGILQDGASYVEVLSTGNLSAATEGIQNSNLYLREENEQLLRGMQVRAIATDDHFRHIKKHNEVYASPDVRADPELMQNILAHQTEHIQLIRTTDPGLLIAVGMDPNQLQLIMQMSQQQQGADPGQQENLQAGKMPEAAVTNEESGPADLPELPDMPVDPSTGQPASV